MAFKKRFFRRRRRGRKSETYTLVDCFDCTNIYGDMRCGGAHVDVVELMTMHTPRNPIADATEVTSGADRFITVAGIKFQAEHSHDPSETQGFAACDPSPFTIAFLLRIWEAIVVLPLLQGSFLPIYLPDFTQPLTQGGDLADRVLWKRLSVLPIWGLTSTNSVPQLESTIRDEGHGPVVVKSKVRLDDRHGLFYVRNYVHNIFGLPPVNASCTVDQVTNPCVIPVTTDMWFKTYVHAIR